MLSASRHAEKLRIRVPKGDAAFVYFILEAQEGVTSYSTLPNERGDANRDIELCFSSEFRPDVDRILSELESAGVALIRS